MMAAVTAPASDNATEGEGKTKQKSLVLRALPASTTRLIGSCQVITSVYAVVKELIENALDAHATAIDVKLENGGLDKIELRDNGCGIKQSDAVFLAKRFHTSKITSFSDLESIATYGFRGEALGSLCTVSELSITTKTKDEDIGMCHTFDHHGEIIASKPSHLGQGTTVCASHLFKNLPVRKHFYNTSKKKKEELKRVEDLVMSYGVIQPDVRISLRHNKDLLWQKFSVLDHRTVLMGILSMGPYNQLDHKRITEQTELGQIHIESFLPKSKSNTLLSTRAVNDRGFLFINKRPIHMKEVDKLVRKYYMASHNIDNGRHPIYLLSIVLPSAGIDVNVEPNKTRVMIVKQDILTDLLKNILKQQYGELKPKEKGTNTELNNNNDNDNNIDDGQELNNKQGGEPDNLTQSQPLNTDVCSAVTDMNSKTASCISDTNGLSTVIEKSSNRASQCRERTASVVCVDNLNCNLITSSQCNNNNNIETADSYSSLPRTQNNSTLEPDKDNCAIDVTRSTSDKSSYINRNNTPTSWLSDSDTILMHSRDCSNLTEQSASLLDNADKEITDQISESNNDIFVDDTQLNHALHDLDDILCTYDDTSKTMSDACNLTDGKKPYKEKSSNLNTGIKTEKMLSHERDEEISVIGNEAWSKGVSLQNNSGNRIQPVAVLTSDGLNTSLKKKRSISSPASKLGPPAKRRASLTASPGQPTLYDLVNKQPVKKPKTSFMLFSADVRRKVQADDPHIDIHDLGKIISDRWKALSENEKTHYEDKARKELEKYKDILEGNKKGASSSSITGPKLTNISYSRPVSYVPRCKGIDFSIAVLKDQYDNGFKESQTQRSGITKLLGFLKSQSVWVCCHGNSIRLVLPYRIEETIIYHSLLKNHQLPSHKLDEAIPLNESNLGRSGLYKTLLNVADACLQSSVPSYLDDDCITANGLQIHCWQDGVSGKPRCELTHVSKDIPGSGISDLREILDAIRNTRAESLHECRPVSVITYLKGEAMRMAAKAPVKQTRRDMEDILAHMRDTLPDGCVTCFHDQPFYHELYNIENIPQSQEDSQIVTQMN